MEKERFGNFSASLIEFHQDIALNIESIVVKPNADIREDSKFELICTAKGSSNLIFRWYKDGVFVDLSRATRKIWEEIRAHKLYYENHLVVSKASKLDEGVYTCQISDFDVQSCRSTTIHILSKLDLRIVPPSATVYRGESIRIRCISYDIHQRYGQLGFSWTKNGILFKSNSKFEMWEDVYPYGSILKISAIQKSANYTCISSTKVGQFSKSVYVYVVDRGSVELCPNNTIYNVKWPASSPGSPTLGDCPQKYSGQSKRICEQRDFGKPMWLTPDFSQCVSDHLITIYNQFRELTFGYQKTNSSAVLNSCLEYAMNRQTNFLPGEAGFLLEVLQEINKYLQLKSIHSEQENAASVILRILDILMQSENSLNNQQQVKQLQALVQSSVLNLEIITAPLPLPSTSLRNQQMHSFRIYKENIKMLPFNSQIYGDHLFSDQLYMEMRQTKNLEKITLDGNNIVFSVVSYKNLTNFLPRLYFERNSFAPDINYVLASRIITTTLYHATHNHNLIEVKPLYLDMMEAHVEIVFQHGNTHKTKWIPICGYDSQATFEVTWQTDRCITETIMENITKCNCPITGAFVVLQTKKNVNPSIRNTSRPIFVIISCGLCFMQSCITFTILLPVLYKRKCPVTFLKMQFCTSTSTAMAIFMLGLLKLLPQDWHGIISSSLAGVLLLGTSTLIGIALIMQSELGPRKNISSLSTSSSSTTTTTATTTPSTSSPNGLSSSSASALASGVRGAIALSWFLPLLYTISSPLVYTILGYWPFNWWLEYGYFSFIMFIIIELLYIILFILLFISVLGKLKFLAKKNDKYNIMLIRRIGLIYRAAILLTLKIIVDVSYLVYLNLNEFNCSYIFAVSSFLLGIFILICFVIKAEMKLNSESTINKNITKHNMEDYCSGSINSPLSFYTNHEIERDNDSVPPTSMQTTKIPLTILTTAHCTLDHITNSKNNLDTFLSNETLSGGVGGGGTCIGVSITESSILDHHGNNNKDSYIGGGGSGTESTTNYHCFELLGHHGQSQHEFYENFQNEPIKCYNGIVNHANNNHNNKNEYNSGVCTLDILKGVSKADSIIGIRSNLVENDSVCQRITKKRNNKKSTIKQRCSSPLAVTAAAATAIDKINMQHQHVITNGSHNKIHSSISSSSSESSHKSVSIPQLYTQDQSNKQDSEIESSVSTAVQPPSLPIITITSTDDEKAMDGMLNRISDDLDYLLNRTSEIPSSTTRRMNNNNNKQIEMEIISQSSTSSISSSSNSSSSIPLNSVGLNQQQQSVSHTGQLSSSIPSSSSQQQPLLIVNTNSNCAFSIHDVILEECED